MGVPPNGWFKKRMPLTLVTSGYPHFRKLSNTHYDIHDPTTPTIFIIPKTKATCTYTPFAALTSGFYPTHPS